MRLYHRSTVASLAATMAVWGWLAGYQAHAESVLEAYISTGDNHWVADLLPIDSPASIEASFDFLERLGVRRVYWRGLQEAVWLESFGERPENCRYYSWWQWGRKLCRNVDPDRLAVAAAKRRKIELWGVGPLFDWGCQADAPCSGDYPHQGESRLRTEHPQWVPVDRHGVLRQGGPIELAYPEARAALVDLLARAAIKADYAGVMFFTYCENFDTRFQDEFGYNEPIVREFKKRTGVDITRQPFTRTASRHDWYGLRGEYVTQFLRELKAALAPHKKRLGLFINPQQPHFPQPWNVPDLMLTGGHIYFDLEGWLQAGLVDRLMVYGYCHTDSQNRAVRQCQWLTRDTEAKVSFLTSSPLAERWVSYRHQGVDAGMALHDEGMYLRQCNLSLQPVEALDSPDAFARLCVLRQIIDRQTKATAEQVRPSLGHPNLLVRRMALRALAKLGDRTAVPWMEGSLDDPEMCVRGVAAIALRELNRPESATCLLAAVDRDGCHPLLECVTTALMRITPPPRAELLTALASHKNPVVRLAAARGLQAMVNDDVAAGLAKALGDDDRRVRFYAAMALGQAVRSTAAVDALIRATAHDDPVTADRAATSLAAILARKHKETSDRLPAAVKALADLYARLGDGCTRADADWGYRPVGNALLKLGEPGEAVLKQFMVQTTDRRLADQAWRSLFIRQDNGGFSEVSEADNEAAFKLRPAWLDRPNAPAKVGQHP